MGWENALGFTPYNERFRVYRKNMSRIIGSRNAVSQFNGLQEAEVGHFLLHVLNNPDKLTEHIRRYVTASQEVRPVTVSCRSERMLSNNLFLNREAGAVILKIAYGYTAEQNKIDPLIDMAGDAMDKFAKAAVPGAFAVDVFPFCTRRLILHYS